MTQELEIEYKNLLTKDEYDQIMSAFSIKEDHIISQENHYFDTANFSLKSNHSALRIREKNGAYTLTLKQPATVGLLETHQKLSVEDAKAMLSGGKLVEGQIKQIISNLTINPDEIEYFGSLTTNRVEFEYQNGLLVLDTSFYLNQIDYEVEYEVTDEKEGKLVFIEFLKSFNIPIRQTANKIQRFYQMKQQLS